MSAAPGAKLTTDWADRKLWLVRVPPYVAKKWNAACEVQDDGMAVDDDEDDTHHQALGTIMARHVPGESKTELVLELAGVTESEQHLPRSYLLQESSGVPPMSVMSFERPTTEAAGGSAGGNTGGLSKARVEGAVSKKYDLVPVGQVVGQQGGGSGVVDAAAAGGNAGSSSGGGGGIVLDPAYRLLSQKRRADAERKVRTVQMIDNIAEARKMQRKTESVYETMRGKQVKAPEPKHEKKRLRLEKGELERVLFQMFEKQPHWHFVQLQRETEQPSTWLKEVLNDIAFQNKRGPHKDLWELQKQYKGAAAAAAAALAATQAAAADVTRDM